MAPDRMLAAARELVRAPLLTQRATGAAHLQEAALLFEEMQPRSAEERAWAAGVRAVQSLLVLRDARVCPLSLLALTLTRPLRAALETLGLSGFVRVGPPTATAQVVLLAATSGTALPAHLLQ